MLAGYTFKLTLYRNLGILTGKETARHVGHENRRHYVRWMPDAVLDKIAAHPNNVARKSGAAGDGKSGIPQEIEVSD